MDSGKIDAKNSKIAAVFDGQVFRPTEAIELPANTRVQLTIEPVTPEEQETVSFLQTARSLNLDGSSDWSVNFDKYLYHSPIIPLSDNAGD